MPKPTRVRVSFELTREEAVALRHIAISAAPSYTDDGTGLRAKDALDIALCRGLARYDARTKWEVGDG